MSPQSWKHHVAQGLMLVLAVAVVGRIAWELLAPLIPALVVLCCLLALFSLLIGRWRR